MATRPRKRQAGPGRGPQREVTARRVTCPGDRASIRAVRPGHAGYLIGGQRDVAERARPAFFGHARPPVLRHRDHISGGGEGVAHRAQVRAVVAGRQNPPWMSTISGAARVRDRRGSLRSTTCSGRGPYRRVRSGGGAGRSRTSVTCSSGQARGWRGRRWPRCRRRTGACRMRAPRLPARRLRRSRDAVNASATAGSPYRTSRAPWRARARASARCRARSSDGSVTSLRSRATAWSSRAVRPGRLVQLGEDRLGRFRLPGQGAQRVERGDVARPLPDRCQRGLTVQPRQPRVLHVAVASQALERLRGVRRRACTPSTSSPPAPGGGTRPPARRRGSASNTVTLSICSSVRSMPAKRSRISAGPTTSLNTSPTISAVALPRTWLSCSW